jgi:hypothetical protein
MSSDLAASRTLHWNSRLEEYFTETGEKAHCYSWLHKRSEELYSGRTIFIDLPVIILGTLNGAVSVGSDSLFGGSQYASVCVGAVALLTAILSTVGSYFAWARRSEGHRIASINYAKLYRFLSVEMSLPRAERMSPQDLLKYVKQEYDRLAEISPLIPSTIIGVFRQRFSEGKYAEIAKPEDTNGLTPIIVYKGADDLSSPARLSPNVQIAASAIGIRSSRPSLEIDAASAIAPVVSHA